jgi:predicted AlkP superfamily phosphohydrolase/phosphomutase
MPLHTKTTRTLLCCLLIATALPALAQKRVVILGFDGVDPGIVNAMFQAGELPNLKQLADTGTFTTLQTSIPPQSPAAWNSFMTSRTTGGHGIFDFVRRDPRTYMPMPGYGSDNHTQLGADGSVLRPAHSINFRKGDPFWVEADRQGATTKILSMPFAYPADDLQQGCMLSGLGVPDIRCTQSTFFSFSTDYDRATRVAGGKKVPLKFQGNTATVMVEGAYDSRTRNYMTVPVEIRADRSARTITIGLPGQSVEVAEGAWTPWLEWQFEVSPQHAVQAISRFHLLECGDHVRLYMTCLQFHPRAPYMQFTSPPSYAAELADRYGLYKTIGWHYDTHGLRRDVLPEDVFLSDVRDSMAWRAMLAKDELDRGNFDLLVAVWTATDRVSHTFWHHRDPKHPLHTAEGAAQYGRAIEDVYTIMDGIVGDIVPKLNEDDLLMILSDHGFHSFRKGLNVNTWLVRNGYMVLADQEDAATAFTNDRYFRKADGRTFTIDWNRTKAYSIGLGAIFLNLKGREGQGIVEPSEADALIDEIRAKLIDVIDPETGDRVLNKIYTREVFTGAASADAPDLQLGYADGYQTSKAAAAGAAPFDLFEINDDKWSGDHASSDMESTAGVLFSNRKIAGEPAIIDLGPTALQQLGLKIPDDYNGKPLTVK